MSDPRPALTVATVGLLLGLSGCSEWSLSQAIRDTGSPSYDGALALTPVEVHTRFDGKVAAERGRLRVPMSREPAAADSVSLHFIRYPARTEVPGDPIVYLAGGPGGSGTASSLGDRFRLFDRLREVSDVIALDQRGTWNSEPYMVCPGVWSFPTDAELTEDALAESLRPWVEDCYRHWTDQGVDLDAFNTRESARDLEGLRKALGAERLDLWAISYGTHLALEYARTYPESVGRMVLAGVEGTDQTLKSPAAIERAIERIDAFYVARGVAPLSLRAHRILDDVVADPIRGTFTDEEGAAIQVRLNRLDLQRTIFGSAGERADLDELDAGLDATLRGELAPASQASADWRSGERGLAMSLAMDCASWASPARLERLDREARTSTLGDAANLLVRAKCRSWPGVRLETDFHEPVQSGTPTLFISGGLDVRTPLENAEEVARGFPNSWHLVITDGAHDDDLLIRAPAVGDMIYRFFSGGPPTVRRTEVEIG